MPSPAEPAVRLYGAQMPYPESARMVPTDPPPDTARVNAVPLYTYDDVARLWGVKKPTVYSWVRKGMIPSPVYLGATARWTHAQWEIIKLGPSLPGMHERTESVRATVGRKGGNPNVVAKKKPKKKPKPSSRSSTTKKASSRSSTTKKATTKKAGGTP